MSQMDEDDVRAALRDLVPDLPQPADRLEMVLARASRRRRLRGAAPVAAAVATAALLLGTGAPWGTERRPDAPVASSAAERLAAAPWSLFDYSTGGGEASQLHVAASTLAFDADGGFSAEACGTTSGTVSIDQNRLTFTEVPAVDATCGASEASATRAVANMLAQAPTWTVRSSPYGSELVLTRPSGDVLRYWRSPVPVGPVSGVAWPSCDMYAADLADRIAYGDGLIERVPVPASFRPVGVVRCLERWSPQLDAMSDTAHVRLLVQQQTSASTEVARIASALRQPATVTPDNMYCAMIAYPELRLLLVDAGGRYLPARTPKAACGGPQPALTAALDAAVFTTVSSKPFPTTAPTTAPTPIASSGS
ncbi:MAG TPA: META domain-containing protein [Actinomycetales bacterium]|jgi:heat shock protein HslJ